MSIKRVFYKIYKFPFLISILYQYSDTYVQIYIANTIGIFFNKALAGDTNYIAGSAVAFIGIVFGIMLIQSFTAIYIDLEKQKKKYKFKRYLYEEFLDNSLSSVEKLTTGEILTRLEKDVDKVISALDGSWGIIIAAGISSITYVIYMGKISMTAAAIIFVMGCLPFLSQIILKNAFTRTYDGYYKTEDDIAAHIKETIDGFEHIKLYNMYSRMEKIYYNLQKKNGKWAMAVEKAFITGKSMNEGLSSIAKFGMYGLLGYFLYKGIIKIGDVVQMVLISKKLFASLQSIFEQYQNLTETEVAIERLDEMIPADEEREKSSGQNIEDIEKIDVKALDSLKKFIKESEKTIISITHDERLIDVFDRMCRLEDGRFMEVNSR